MFWGCVKKQATTQTEKNPEALPLFRRVVFFRGTLLLLGALFAQQGVALQIDSEDCTGDDTPGYFTSGIISDAISGSKAQPDFSRLVIIIDDLGHNLSRGRAALALPGKLNYAVLPYTPHGKRLAHKAAASGKEVMLHTPMSNLANTPVGRGALTPELSATEFHSTLNAALDQFPQIVGINNHMGSELTQQRAPMARVMRELRERQLYFVDSRTSESTVAAAVATEFHVPNLSRHVFLDNDISEQAIDARFQEVLKRAEQEGFAVAIGHPHAETIAYLQKALPHIEERGIRLAFVSEVLAQIDAPLQRPLDDKEIIAQLDSITPGGCGPFDPATGDSSDAALKTAMPTTSTSEDS